MPKLRPSLEIILFIPKTRGGKIVQLLPVAFEARKGGRQKGCG